MKTIVLTGGGTAGHVTPNIALLPYLRKENAKIYYIGEHEGIEKELIKKEDVEYFSVSTGKLRRYLSAKNVTDMFKVVEGVAQAYSLLRKLKPDVVFSKGGFVAVPVVIGAKLNGIDVVIHESDITPGLANKIAMPFAKTVCTTFPETLKYIKAKNAINTGSPIRDIIFSGDKEKGRKLCGFKSDKPVVMIMGGSMGAVKINNCIKECLDELLKKYNVAHLCGKGNLDKDLLNKEGYKEFEYLSDDLPDIFALADLIVSRAGSNSISEFLALKKPNLLIPLSARASRGDQILNARSFEKQGFSAVLDEDEMTKESLIKKIDEAFENRDKFIENMGKSHMSNGTENVMKILRPYLM